MQIITIRRTSEMSALQHVAKVRESSFSTEVKFVDRFIGADKVVFKKDYRSKGLKVDQVEIDGSWKHIFWATDMAELSHHQQMYVGAAMIKLGLETMAWDDVLIVLEAPAVERVVIVDRPVYQTRPRETVVIRQQPTRTHRDPEMDTAVAVGAAIGAGLGLLGTILRNR